VEKLFSNRIQSMCYIKLPQEQQKLTDFFKNIIEYFTTVSFVFQVSTTANDFKFFLCFSYQSICKNTDTFKSCQALAFN